MISSTEGSFFSETLLTGARELTLAGCLQHMHYTKTLNPQEITIFIWDYEIVES